MTRILVTGASGLLGLNFALHYCREHEIIGAVHRNPLQAAPFQVLEADLSISGNVAKVIEKVRPEMVLNCAAMANVDACEVEPQLAEAINARMPGELAKACHQTSVRLIHISTDAVFDGLRGKYVETDSPNPQNVYARTKLEGECAVSSACAEALIARVNFYGWSLHGTRSLAEHFYYNLADNQKLKGFTDVFFSPLYVKELAEILMQMADRELAGMYHVVSPDAWSKYDFGIAIAERFGFQPELIRPISWKEAGLVAHRSPNLTLLPGKLIHDLKRTLPNQRDGIERLYQDFHSGHAGQIRRMARKNQITGTARE